MDFETLSEAVNVWLGKDRASLKQIAEEGALTGTSLTSAQEVAEAYGLPVKAFAVFCVFEATWQMMPE